MKQILRKISSIMMAFVVLFSTMSFTFSEHYCGLKLVDIGVFSKAEACGMETQKQTSSGDCELSKSDCCKDEVKQFTGQKELNTSFSSLNFDQQIFVASFTYAYLNLFDGLAVNIIPFKNYTPPLLVADILVLDQVLII
jgi:hypothetical protein